MSACLPPLCVHNGVMETPTLADMMDAPPMPYGDVIEPDGTTTRVYAEVRLMPNGAVEYVHAS